MSPPGGGRGAWKVFYRLHALVMRPLSEEAAPVIFNYLRRRRGRLSVKSQQRRLFLLWFSPPADKSAGKAGSTRRIYS